MSLYFLNSHGGTLSSPYHPSGYCSLPSLLFLSAWKFTVLVVKLNVSQQNPPPAAKAPSPSCAVLASGEPAWLRDLVAPVPQRPVWALLLTPVYWSGATGRLLRCLGGWSGVCGGGEGETGGVGLLNLEERRVRRGWTFLLFSTMWWGWGDGGFKGNPEELLGEKKSPWGRSDVGTGFPQRLWPLYCESNSKLKFGPGQPDVRSFPAWVTDLAVNC